MCVNNKTFYGGFVDGVSAGQRMTRPESGEKNETIYSYSLSSEMATAYDRQVRMVYVFHSLCCFFFVFVLHLIFPFFVYFFFVFKFCSINLGHAYAQNMQIMEKSAELLRRSDNSES